MIKFIWSLLDLHFTRQDWTLWLSVKITTRFPLSRGTCWSAVATARPSNSKMMVSWSSGLMSLITNSLKLPCMTIKGHSTNTRATIRFKGSVYIHMNPIHEVCINWPRGVRPLTTQQWVWRRLQVQMSKSTLGLHGSSDHAGNCGNSCRKVG